MPITRTSSAAVLSSINRRSSVNLSPYLTLTMVLASAISARAQTNDVGQPVALPSSVEQRSPRFSVYGDEQLALVNGFVSAREFDIEGDRFPFRDLHVHLANKASVGVQFNKSDRSAFEGEATFAYLRGSTTLTSDRIFNQTTLQGGSTLDTSPEWVEFRFTYLDRVRNLRRGASSIWLLVGADYHYVNWNFDATIAPNSVGN